VIARKTSGRVRRSTLAGIRIVVLDVDGVLTDGRIIYDADGTEYKSFDVHDGYGIRRALASGIRFALITGKRSKIVSFRARELGITEVHQGVTDKLKVFNALLGRHRLTAAQACVMGDDEPDLPILLAAGFSAAPRGAVQKVRDAVRYVTRARGGRGAVREVLELISRAK
jgi:3-deoxy-D-manno-octulosonate 8-phosphate phosphatase (KDO 8-P phosphatase)